MANRPPQRAQRRPDGDAILVPPRGVAHELGATGGPPVQAAASAEVRAVPASRERFLDLLAGLRAQGGLALTDEAAILREYDLLLAELDRDKARLEVEFRERTARDGDEAGKLWLAAAAEALGRRQGERMRHLLQTIPALSQSPSQV